MKTNLLKSFVLASAALAAATHSCMAAAEPEGPSSRNTGLVISEIMYHPKPTNSLEFIEIANMGLIPEDLAGYRISGDVNYTFPANTVLEVGARIVVARYPAVLEAAYGITGVRGPWVGDGAAAQTNALPDDEGLVRLRNRSGAVLLEVNYQGARPWPLAADGSGHSLVLSHPSYGESSPKAWSASNRIGGSPGAPDVETVDPIAAVVINEFLAHTDEPLFDYVELYNHSALPVDISGAYLSDDRDTNKFRIPDGTTLPARGFISFDQNQLGFSLSSGGERIYLVNAAQDRVIDTVAFEAQANGVSSGRYPDGAPDFHELNARTPGAANSPILIHDIVINEIMFNPISDDDDDEYVELYNRGTSPVNVGNWRFTAGISYRIPEGTVIAPSGYLVIAKDKQNLLANHSQLNDGNTLGNYGGVLANGGERVALAMPDYFLVTNNNVVVTQANFVVVDEVTYADSGRWAHLADGGGSSLELIDPNSNNSLPANWADSDETQKAPWTTIINTGTLDHNYPVDSAGGAINEIQAMILGRGEALMDDLSVSAGAEGNRVVNPGFDNGLTGWLIQGNHVRSFLEPAGPGNPTDSMHIVATAGGDNGANRVESNLTSPLTPNTTNVTISGRFRWLSGFPIVLIRLHGGALEAVGNLDVPKNLGTPGVANSRRVTNAGPAVYDVAHSPVLPAANQAVVVTARVSDPDGVASVELKYRIDPSPTPTTLVMRDDGTAGDAVAGDGLYSATIPGRATGTNAFRVVATDTASASSTFPDMSMGEALFRWGEPQIPGSLGVYHIWMTSSNIALWTNRERLSNQAIDGTFVYGNYRAVYNAGARYRGSPFTRNPSSPNGVGVAANYVWTLPDDDQILGTDELNLDSLEPSGRDSTALREVTSFTMFEQLDYPVSYQRYVHVVINGVTSASRNIPIYTDSQQPNGEYVRMWFPEDNEGDLFKIDDWFEFDDTPARLGNKSASLESFVTQTPEGPVKKKARYRWSWEKKFNSGLNDDYSGLYAAVDALNAPNDTYIQQIEREFELREWLTAFAFRHVIGDWDGYGYNRGKNQFSYRTTAGKFWMLMWDLDFSLGCTGGHGPTQNLFDVASGGPNGSDNMPEVARMYNNPYTRRIYLQALQRIAEGPLQDENFLPTLTSRYNALLANGVNAVSPFVGSGAQGISIPAWIQQRRGFILTNTANANRISLFTNTAFAVTSPLQVTTSSNTISMTGTASLTTRDILINGKVWPVTWVTVNSWRVDVVLGEGVNNIEVGHVDVKGNSITNSQTVVATYTGPAPDPRGAVVFNEIMFNPLVPDAEFIELFNTSSTLSYDLSGWRVNGVDYTFAPGASIAPRGYLVLFKNLPAFVQAYGPSVVVHDRFEGNLQSGGEIITLIKPGATPEEDVVIDKVRYEGVRPWPVGSNDIATASSIQLIDAAQDNSRPLNWTTLYAPPVYGEETIFPGATNGGWRQGVFTGRIQGPPSSPGTNFLLFINTAGSVFVDDLVLVEGEVAGVGPNLLQNGDFESDLSPAWNVFGNHSVSEIDTTFGHESSRSLRVVSTGAGSASSNIKQFIPAPLTNNTYYTLSYWFYSTDASSTLVFRTTPGSLFVAQTNTQVEVIPPYYLPAPLLSRAVQRPTPGSNNADRATLADIPPLWLNELQPQNTAGIQDNMGEREPWIELYNAGSTVLNLDSYYLANNYDTNLTQWAFPAGSTIAPGAFKIIWADGEEAENTSAELHTNFRLATQNGTVALVRVDNGKSEVLDYLTYTGIGPDISYGDYPDGQPFNRVAMRDVTPGGTNIARPFILYINEWLAGNTNSGADPADGQYEDWFEVFNPGTNVVDLGGLWFGDSGNSRFQVPTNGQYVVPPRGFLLVWADSEPNQNDVARPDLHVNFQLGKGGDSITLYAADGRTIIDQVSFVNQVDDISEGRYPDGGNDIATLAPVTPGAANLLPGGNSPPVIAAVGTRNVILGQAINFNLSATDVNPEQALSFRIVSGAPAGATLSPGGLFSWNSPFGLVGATYEITVEVTDNGVPPLSDTETFTLIALPPAPQISINGNQVTIAFQVVPGKTYRIEFKDDLNAVNWERLNNQDYVANLVTLAVTDSITGRSQRFYRLVQLD